MAAARLLSAMGTPKLTRSTSVDSESVLSAITVDASSNSLSNSSTPPTSAADSASISSASLKLDAVAGLEADTADESEQQTSAPPSRTRRPRQSAVSTYNINVLSGTAVHAPRRFRKGGDEAGEASTRRRTISGDTLVGLSNNANSSSETIVTEANRLVADGIDALDLKWSVKALPKSRSMIGLNSPRNTKKSRAEDLSRRRSTRSTGAQVESLTKKLSVLGKRGRNAFESGLSKAKRELLKLADTPEFAKIETKPVIHEVWANGKLWTGEEPPKKKAKISEVAAAKPKEKEEEKVAESPKIKKRREKVWLNKGLYAGQEGKKLDWFLDKSEKEKGTSNLPEYKPNGLLPLPMWKGQRLLQLGRDFKLPFDVCSPLPPGQPKPDEWRKVPKSEFSVLHVIY